MEKQNRFYQNKRKIKEALSHFTFHISVFGLFEVFIIVLPNFVEIDKSISILVYYLIVALLSIPVLYLGYISYKRYKSYSSIQKMDEPLLELSPEGLIYRVDANVQHRLNWSQIENVEFIENDTGKGINREICLSIKGVKDIKDNKLKIRLFKLDAELAVLKVMFNEYWKDKE
jgi:hypothetical protein